MIDFDIDTEQKTPYLDLLESLIQQSHALKTIHNPKTWCLSALTYALHLNDCLILFRDLKDRWQKNLPFTEAWDVDFRDWKSRIWTAANNIKSTTSECWKSLCDTDYAQFIDLSNKVVDGKITIIPLMEFVKGKETCIGKIIVDAGRRLSALFSEIESTSVTSCGELYIQFLSNCLNSYKKKYEDSIYLIETPSEYLPFDTWAASKTQKKLPSAIDNLLSAYDKKLRNHKIIGECWMDCYDSESNEIDKEGIAREIFSKRRLLISATKDEEGFDVIFRRLIVMYFLIEKIHPDLANSEEGNIITKILTPENVKNLNKIKDRISKDFLPKKSNKYDWIVVLNILKQEGVVRSDASNADFERLINHPLWFPDTISSKAFSDHSYAQSGSPDKWTVPAVKEKQAKHLEELYYSFAKPKERQAV